MSAMLALRLVRLYQQHDEYFYELLGRFNAESETDFAAEISVVSNFNLYFDIAELSSSFSECAHRRMKISRMNRERQSNLMDIIEEYRDESDGKSASRFVGSIGFIKVNRLNKDAALVFLFNRVLAESIRICLFQVIELAQMHFFGLNRLYCCMSKSTSSTLMIPILQSANFCHYDNKENDDQSIIAYVATLHDVDINKSNMYNQNLVAVPTQSVPNQLSLCSPLQVPYRSVPNQAWQLCTPVSAGGKFYYCPVPSPTPSSVSSISNINARPLHKDFDASCPKITDHTTRISESQLDGSSNIALLEPKNNAQLLYANTNCPQLSADAVDNIANYDKSCVFWMKGVCAYGSSCHFKHSTEQSPHPEPDKLLEINTSENSLNERRFPKETDPHLVLLDLVNNATSYWLGLLRYLPYFLQLTLEASPGRENISCSREVDTPSSRSISSSRSLVDDRDDKSMEDFTATLFSKAMVERVLNYRDRCGHHSSLPAIASLSDLLLIIGMKREGLPSLLQLNQGVLRDFSLSGHTPDPQGLPVAPSLSQVATPPWFAGNVMYYSPTRRNGPNPQLYSPFPRSMPFIMPPLSPYYNKPVALYSNHYSPFYNDNNSGGGNGSHGLSYPGVYCSSQESEAVVGTSSKSVSRSRLGGEEEKIPLQSSPDSIARSPADYVTCGKLSSARSVNNSSVRGKNTAS